MYKISKIVNNGSTFREMLKSFGDLKNLWFPKKDIPQVKKDNLTMLMKETKALTLLITSEDDGKTFEVFEFEHFETRNDFYENSYHLGQKPFLTTPKHYYQLITPTKPN